jgi:pimeloyl-ACP methyl ester carboxylesterase
MHSLRRGYLDLPWGQVHYRTAEARMADAAADLPVLILVHQSPLSARNYERALPLLAASCRPFALDTPGYGGSAPPPAQWEVDDYVAWIMACADALGAARFHLLGRATGALFAAAAALRHPARLRTLVLHGLPVYSDAERADRLANFAPPYRPAEDGSHLAWIWDRIRGEYPWLDPALATQFVRDYLAAGPDFATAYRAMWRYDLRAAASSGIAVPTLLIGGTRDRIAAMQPRAQALLPGAEAVTLDGATDFVAEHEPERFARCVTAFIARHA